MNNRIPLLGVVIFLIAVLVVITACNMPKVGLSVQPPTATAKFTPTPSPTPTLKPCGTDLQCLIAAARTCTPQTGLITLSLDMGIQVKITYEFTIKGKVGNECNFGVRAQNIQVQYSKQTTQHLKAQGLSAQQIEEQRKQIVSQMRATAPNGTCKGSGEALATLLKKWQEGRFSIDDWRAFKCQGQGFSPNGSSMPLTPTPQTIHPPLTPTPLPAPSSLGQIPNPKLTFIGTEPFTKNGKKAGTRYEFSIANWRAYPKQMFALRSDLPPCGLNTNASRTWVSFYDADTHRRIYGYCALNDPKYLQKLGYTILNGKTPPRHVYVVLTDRATKKTYKSNVVEVP